MPRYIKQRSCNTCGPVAVYNALIWANPDQYYNLRTLIKECDPHWRFGTPHEGITNILESCNSIILNQVIEYPKISDIHNNLTSGHSIILEFHAGNDDHYVFLFQHHNKIQIVNNRMSEPTVQTITLHELEEEFLQPFRHIETERFKGTIPYFDESNRDFPRIWILAKNF